MPFTPAQRELLDRLKAELGDEQMRQWGGDWVANYVRPMPRALAVALDEMALKRKEGTRFERPAHWLKATAKHIHAAQMVHVGNGLHEPPRQEQP